MSAGHPFAWRTAEIQETAPALSVHQASVIAKAAAAAHAISAIAHALAFDTVAEDTADAETLGNGVVGGLQDAVYLLGGLIGDELQTLAESFAPKGAKR